MWVPEVDLEHAHEILMQYKNSISCSEYLWRHFLTDKKRNPDMVEYISAADVYALRTQRELKELSK